MTRDIHGYELDSDGFTRPGLRVKPATNDTMTAGERLAHRKQCKRSGDCPICYEPPPTREDVELDRLTAMLDNRVAKAREAEELADSLPTREGEADAATTKHVYCADCFQPFRDMDVRLCAKHAGTDAAMDALEMASKLVEVARRHFPKSMHNSDKFQLEQTCAAITAPLAAVRKGK